MFIAENLIKFLKSKRIDFFAGVPDSILKNFSTCIRKKDKHIIAANEGNAVALGIGYHLATKKIPLVYMQNSGLGNAINPLISIAHKKVYSIPILLLIGWRGYPKIKDEPQHKATGKITTKLLKSLNIKYCVVRNTKDFKNLEKLILLSKKTNKPVACLVPPGFMKINKKKVINPKLENNKLTRFDFISSLLRELDRKTKIISATGFTSRELHKIRQDFKIYKGRDFYMVGGMGHATMVAAAHSMYFKNNTVCLDGDGSLIMHMGSLLAAGKHGSKRFKHILLNNNSHESVGDQKTFINEIKLKQIIKGFNYKNYFLVKNKNNLKKFIKSFLNSSGPSFMEVRIKNGSPNNLGRPKKLIKIKNKFMQ